MKAKLMKTTLLALGLTLIQAPAFANYSCWGKLDELGLSGGSNPAVHVRLNTTGLVWVVCYLNGDVNCKSMYAMLLAAQSGPSRPNIGLFYTPNGKTCETMGDWVEAKPYYILTTDDY